MVGPVIARQSLVEIDRNRRLYEISDSYIKYFKILRLFAVSKF